MCTETPESSRIYWQLHNMDDVNRFQVVSSVPFVEVKPSEYELEIFVIFIESTRAVFDNQFIISSRQYLTLPKFLYNNLSGNTENTFQR